MPNSTVNYFPFQSDTASNSMKRCENVTDTMICTIKQFLLTRKGSRLGNNVGSSLPLMLFNAYTDVSLKAESNNIKKELIDQFPEFEFYSLTMENKIEDEVSGLNVTIELATKFTDIISFSLYFPKTI